MDPVLNPGRFVFAFLPPSAPFDSMNAVAFIREPEGTSVILSEATARRYGLAAEPLFAWITLSVHSDLEAVGLTAAFASVLGRAGISCNVVAGLHHDHLFVPAEQADAAMTELRALQQAARSDPDSTP